MFEKERFLLKNCIFFICDWDLLSYYVTKIGNMSQEELRRLQMSQSSRAQPAGNQQRFNNRMRYCIGQNRTSYRPNKPYSYREKHLTRNDIIKALSQGQERIPLKYKDVIMKWNKIKSKEGKGIRSYLEPFKNKHEEPDRLKTHRDYMLDEVEYMNIDFQEEKKLKKSLATRFIHEISDVAGNRTQKKEKRELGLKLISMQMGSMIQSTFSKVKNNKRVSLNPEVVINISQTIYENGFDYQLNERNINKLKKEYEELLKSNETDNSESPALELPEQKEEVKEEPNPVTFGFEVEKDEFLPVLNQLDPNHFKIQDVTENEEDNLADTKSMDYYYPKKMDDLPSILDNENIDNTEKDPELDLLHNFFPSYGISSSIEDAKNFLISHKLVDDEKEINVMRGPFIKYEIKVKENEDEFGEDYDEPVIEYMDHPVDPEIAEIAEIASLLSSKPDFPEGQDPRQQVSGTQQVEEAKRKPEDKLPYEKESRLLPCILSVNQKKTISIDQLIKERYTEDSESITEERMARKRGRENTEIEYKTEIKDSIEANIQEKSSAAEEKKQKTEENEIQLIEITENDSEYRKKCFKTYCEMKNHINILKKRKNSEDKEDIKKYEKRLSKGLLLNYNKHKQSKFKMICDLFMKDQCEYLEKRR